jgi:hypothetical protein
MVAYAWEGNMTGSRLFAMIVLAALITISVWSCSSPTDETGDNGGDVSQEELDAMNAIIETQRDYYDDLAFL